VHGLDKPGVFTTVSEFTSDCIRWYLRDSAHAVGLIAGAGKTPKITMSQLICTFRQNNAMIGIHNTAALERCGFFIPHIFSL
jgi:hypothetical protein